LVGTVNLFVDRQEGRGFASAYLSFLFISVWLTVISEALNKVYGESKIKKTMNIINQAIKQKCLDKVKEKRRQELAKNE
jgi:ABC-type sulfate transport system substrate-binding protein